jgi:hypothetical protein
MILTHAKGFGSYLPDFKIYINSPDSYNRFQKIAKIYKFCFYFHIWLDFVANDHQFGYSRYKIKPIMITITVIIIIIIILCFKILLQKSFASLI